MNSGQQPIKIRDVTHELIGKNVTILGKLKTMTFSGNVMILEISDDTGKINVAILPNKIPANAFKMKKDVKLEVMGRVSLYRNNLQVIAKKIHEIRNGEKIFLELGNGEPPHEETREKKNLPPPSDVATTISHEIIHDLEKEFNEIASFLRKAMDEQRPIWLRFHADVDGYAGAFVLGKAIERYFIEIVGTRNLYNLLKYYPSREPEYSTGEIIRELVNVSDHLKSGRMKPPVIILVDLGSSKESLPAINLAKKNNFDVIVIDHHDTGDVVKESVTLLLNPTLKNMHDEFASGMLCLEVANKIYPDSINDFLHVGAISGLGDRLEVSKILPLYLKLVEKDHDKNSLVDMVHAIDYISILARTQNYISIVERILLPRDETDEGILELLSIESKSKYEQFHETLAQYGETFEINGIQVRIIDVEALLPRKFYPPTGKLIGYLHAKTRETTPEKPLITMGLASDHLIYRSWKTNLDFKEIIKELTKKYPHGQIEGGGHVVAGSLRFIPLLKEEIKTSLLEYIKKITS